METWGLIYERSDRRVLGTVPVLVPQGNEAGGSFKEDPVDMRLRLDSGV